VRVCHSSRAWLSILAAVVLPSCGAPRAPTLSPLEQQTPTALKSATPPLAAPQPPAKGFAVLWPSPAPEAADLLVELRGSEIALARRQELAASYRAQGYVGAAEFFDNTVRLRTGQRLSHQPPPGLVGWIFDAEAEDRGQGPVKLVSALLAEGSYEKAANEALASLKENPKCQSLALLWADSVAWLSLVEPEKVHPDLRERSLRLLLTTWEDGALSYGGAPRGEDLFKRLSDLFAAQGDSLSSGTASALALEMLEVSGRGGEFLVSTRSTLCARVHEAVATQDAFQNWSQNCRGCCSPES
jgi:hypothetical protein